MIVDDEARRRLLNYLADALFCTTVQPSDDASHASIRTATLQALCYLGGPTGCTYHVAEALGRHPSQATARLAWCESVVAAVFDLEDTDDTWQLPR